MSLVFHPYIHVLLICGPHCSGAPPPPPGGFVGPASTGRMTARERLRLKVLWRSKSFNVMVTMLFFPILQAQARASGFPASAAAAARDMSDSSDDDDDDEDDGRGFMRPLPPPPADPAAIAAAAAAEAEAKRKAVAKAARISQSIIEARDKAAGMTSQGVVVSATLRYYV